MATIKSYTGIYQSKKLADILSLESADMCFVNDGTAIKIDANPYNVRKYMWKDVQVTPCWSLTALLGVLPEGYSFELTKSFDGKDYYCNLDGKPIKTIADNPVDACVAMIEKLNELNLL